MSHLLALANVMHSDAPLANKFTPKVKCEIESRMVELSNYNADNPPITGLACSWFIYVTYNGLFINRRRSSGQAT